MFGGSMVAVVTPMTAAGEIDLPAWTRLLEFHAEQGTDAVVVGGTTGESPTLTTAELVALAEAALRVLKGRMPVIAGSGTNATISTVAKSRALCACGVDGLLVVTPYYNRPTQEGLFQHFRAAAENSSVPVILYNVPSRTGVDLLPETVRRLAEVPRIVGVKEATGSVERAQAILRDCRKGFELYSGDDPTALAILEAGGRGVISVTANVAPRLMHEFCAAAVAGKVEQARELDAQLQELHRILFVESNPIPSKWALQQMGLIDSGIRLPLTPLAPALHATVAAALRRAGVLERELKVQGQG